MPHLHYLSSVQVLAGVAPWDWRPQAEFPDEIRGAKGKKARDAWANNPQTIANFYTGYEALNENGRVRQGATADDQNPPVKEHFLVADFDSPISDAMALEAANNFSPKPNRLEKTLSGNWRAVWFLETAIVIPSYSWAKFFHKTFATFAFSPEKMLPGFDRGAWEAPERFWTNSGEWFVIHEEKIPAERVAGWQFLASSKFNWKKAFNSVAIPAEVAAVELEKKYPRFADWPGDFALDSQGPTFWVDGSTSPKSAIVREAGMQTYSDTAGKGFFPWVELLGAEFCKGYEADATGRAVEGIFYDSKSYWTHEDCGWKSYDLGNISRILRVDRGVSPFPGKADGVSDIDRTIRYIQRGQTVLGAAPFICRRPGIVDINGDKFLNIHSKPVMAPAPGIAVWGPAGSFPWISHFLERLFDRGDEKQLQSFLAWLAHFYQASISFDPCSGLLVVLAGAAGVGKSFLVQGIMGRIFGGVGEAAKLLAGEDSFGSENFAKAIWAIDDAKTSADYASHRRLAEGLKRAAANDAAVYHVKYQVPVVISWSGRVVLCLNKDAESLRMLPDMEISIRDKISLYHVADNTIIFPSRKEIDLILSRELAFFCAYLRDFVTPDFAVGTARFGIKPWQDAEIFGRAHQASPSAAFREIFEVWRAEYFTVRKPDAEFWEGGALAMHQSLVEPGGMDQVMREFSVNVLGRRLSSLASTKTEGITHIGKHRTGYAMYRVERPEKLTNKK